MKLNKSWCSLCGTPHSQLRLEEGWFADKLRHNTRGADSAKRLICPKCVKDILSTSGAALRFQYSESLGQVIWT